MIEESINQLDRDNLNSQASNAILTLIRALAEASAKASDGSPKALSSGQENCELEATDTGFELHTLAEGDNDRLSGASPNCTDIYGSTKKVLIVANSDQLSQDLRRK